MASKITTGKKYDSTILGMAKKLGTTPEKVLRAINNLLHGDGAVYRQVIHNPLHGKLA